jgi:protein-S-isoprenylcysteine O-methyltransferase Ste14
MAATHAEGEVTAAAPRRRHWTDWAGFFGMLLFAAKVGLGSGVAGLLMIPILLHEVLIAALFLVRLPARRTAPLGQQVVAYAAGFLMPVFIAAAAQWRPEWLAPTTSGVGARIGAFLWLFGALLSLWPLVQLRQAFSVVPAARTLVTTGPYMLARHPIYTSYLFQYAGMLLLRPTGPFALVLALWFALLWVRIGYEERVLESVFPEYEQYRQRVARFGPRLTRSRAPLPAREA